MAALLGKNAGSACDVASECIETFKDANGLTFSLRNQIWVNPAGDTKSKL